MYASEATMRFQTQFHCFNRENRENSVGNRTQNVSVTAHHLYHRPKNDLPETHLLIYYKAIRYYIDDLFNSQLDIVTLRICKGCDNHNYSTLDSITKYVVSTKYKQNKEYNTIVKSCLYDENVACHL